MINRFRAFIFAVLFALAPCGPALAQLNAAQTWAGTAGGTSTALTATVHNVVGLGDLLGVPIRLLPNGINNGPSTLTINIDTGGTLGPVAIKKAAPAGLAALSGCELKTGQTSVLIYDGTEFVLSSEYSSTNPTYTHLTTGTSLTYTPPPCATGLFVRLIGGGAGGGGGGGAGTNGTAGGTTTFGAFTAAGGQPATSTGEGGPGGTGGTGSALWRYPGGGAASGLYNTTGPFTAGGVGGSSCVGGAGYPNGHPAGANTGSGGAGAGTGGSVLASSGGGGAGECVGVSIPAPLASSYSYTIGTNGAGGTPNGGAGSLGDILITEYYNFLLKRDLDPAANDNSPMWLNQAA